MSEKLPKGWVKTKLGEVCLPVSTIQPEDSPDANFTYFDIGGIDNERNRIAETKTVTGRNAPSRARQAVRKDDILFSTVRTYLRKIARVERDYPNPVASTGFTVIRPAGGVSSQFLFFQILSEDFLQPLHALQTGSSYPAVRNRDVFVQPIVLAPAGEQKRIVTKLDAALNRIANGEKAARHAIERLQRYRAAVLHAAVTGELTRKWRKDNRPSETGPQLLKRLLDERRAQWEKAELEHLKEKGEVPKDTKWKSRYPEPKLPSPNSPYELPEDWTWAGWGQVSDWVTYGFTRPMPHAEKGVPIVTAKNIKAGTIDLDNTHFTTQDAFDSLSKKDVPQRGDILVTKDGTIGRAAVVETDQSFCVNQSVAVIWLRSSPLNRRFLWAVIESEVTQQPIRAKARGVAIKHLSITDFSRLGFPLPPLSEQIEIGHEVQRRLETADRLATTLDRQLHRSQATRHSLLREAFAGRLIPQDSKDEPASVLLSRIRTTRETEAKKPKGKPMPRSRSKKKVSRRSLLDVLLERRKPITPEQLFRESGYEAAFNENDAPQNLVDAFYKELRKLTDKPAKVEEQKDSKHQAWLRALP